MSSVGSRITCAEAGCENAFVKDSVNRKYCEEHSAGCQHGKRRSQCRECGGSQICDHGQRRSKCWFCNPLRWAAHCINRTKGDAKRRNYAALRISPEELVELRRKSDSCVLCNFSLNWDDLKNSPCTTIMRREKYSGIRTQSVTDLTDRF